MCFMFHRNVRKARFGWIGVYQKQLREKIHQFKLMITKIMDVDILSFISDFRSRLQHTH